MTIAIVKNGVLLHTTNEPYIRTEDGYMRPAVVNKDLGFYEFIPARNEATPTQKAQGTTFTVVLLNGEETGVVIEKFIYVDKTQEEIKNETNSKLDAQIDALERQAILPRITRDMHRMVTLQAAAAQGIAESNLLDKNNPHYSAGYARFYEFDAAIALLRASRV